jgi:hypothetical protein
VTPGVSVGLAVTVAVRVAEGVTLGVSVGLAVTVAVRVAEGVTPGVSVGLAVTVAVRVAGGVTPGVSVGLAVTVGDGVPVGRRATIVASIEGEGIRVGVWGASTDRLHPVSHHNAPRQTKARRT